MLQSISTLRCELQRETSPISEHYPETPFVSLNIARISGGVAFNVIPDACEVDVALRPLPGADIDALIDRLRSTASHEGQEIAFEVLGANPPLLLDESSRWWSEVTSIVPAGARVAASFSSDAGFFSQAGHECVLLGPGSITTAHQANEHVPINELEQTPQILERFITLCCMESQPA